MCSMPNHCEYKVLDPDYHKGFEDWYKCYAICSPHRNINTSCSNGYVKTIPTIVGSLVVVSLAVYLTKESWISFRNMEETIGAMNF